MFDPGNGYPENSTTNLMDYKGGKELVKYQWDILHDTGIAGWLDDSEEGQFSVEIHTQILEYCIKQSNLVLDKTIFDKLISGVKDADLKGYNDERLHFDNIFNFANIQIAWNTVHESISPLNIYRKEDAYQLGKYLHAVMDFYAHSNYVELYIAYWYKIGKDLSLLNYREYPPIYEDAIKDPQFFQNYSKFLITGHFNTSDWLNPFVSDQEIANTNGHIHHDLLNKDARGKGRSNIQIIGTSSTLYEYARSCAVRNTIKILNEKNKLLFRLLSYIILALLDILWVKIFILLSMKITGDRLISMALGIIIGLTFTQMLFSMFQMNYLRVYNRLIFGICVSLVSFLIVFIFRIFIKLNIDDYGFYSLIIEFIVISILSWEIVRRYKI